MKKKKYLLGVLLATIFSILLLPNIVSASAKTDEILGKVSKDGKTATFKMVKPTSFEDGDAKINGYLQKYCATENYSIFAYYHDDNYDKCTITIQSDDYQEEYDQTAGGMVVKQGEIAFYDLTISYDEPTKNINVINSYLSKIKAASMDDPKTWYQLEDLSLINYYLTSAKSELWNQGASGRALKYVKELNDLREGTKISFYIDTRAGMQDEKLMFESAFGPMTVYYNDYSYGAKDAGIYLKRILYIPTETEDTKEAYIAAAQKRINEYLGNSKDVVITYGGLLSSLPSDAEDTLNPVTSDGNYYNVKVKDKTYKFYIVKGDETKLAFPTYNGRDSENNIAIFSKDARVPLDTDITATKLNLASLKDKIKTLNYVSYNIELYSAAQAAKIEKLANGLFEVSIPIPNELNGKNLIIYYETTSGKLEQHEVTVKDGNAIFTTNHFSTYTLAENTNSIINPDTSDGIITWLCLGLISLSGLVVLIKRKQSN